jgi:hypothetical protein
MHRNCEDTYPYPVYLLRRISDAWCDLYMADEPVPSFRVISPIDRTCLRSRGDLILLGWRMRAMLRHVVLIVAATWAPAVWRPILMHLWACSKLLSLRTIAAYGHCKTLIPKTDNRIHVTYFEEVVAEHILAARTAFQGSCHILADLVENLAASSSEQCGLDLDNR